MAKDVVRVKALGLLAARLPGGSPTVVDCPEEGRLTADELRKTLGLPDDEVFIVIVNGRRVTADHPLAPGDEVTFVPPVAGG